jgi:hypothetical protein
MPNFNFPKVRKGDDAAQVFSAGFHNACVDALKWVDAQRNRNGAGAANSLVDDPCVVWIKNAGEEDRDRFEILGIDSTVPIAPTDNLDAFKQHFVLNGVTPTAAHSGKFVILLEPIVAGEIGSALAMGVCPCKVQVAAGGMIYADVSDGDGTALEESDSGAQILWIESGTGTKWAIVRLAGGGGGGDIVPIELLDDLVPCGSALACSLSFSTNPPTANYADAFVVEDFFGLSGMAGYRGWAKKVRGGSESSGSGSNILDVYKLVNLGPPCALGSESSGSDGSGSDSSGSESSGSESSGSESSGSGSESSSSGSCITAESLGFPPHPGDGEYVPAFDPNGCFYWKPLQSCGSISGAS